MKKNKILFFIISFTILFLLTYSTISYVKGREKESQTKDIALLLEEFQNQFENFINQLLSSGIVTSEYFSHGTITKESYESLAHLVTRGQDEIYGMNLLDKNGVIVRVYPFKENKLSLGKTTQNIQFLLASVERDEEFWFSPPFTLFQGPQGFVLYIPIRQNYRLVGWIAPVIALETFFHKFIQSRFLKKYHLIIKDVKTGKNYFETSKIPKHQPMLKRQTESIRGREISFISWPKNPTSSTKQLSLALVLSFIMSLFTTYLYGLFEQRLKVSMQLEDVDSLLKLSIQDASNSFIILQNQLELLKVGAGHITLDRISLNTHYISTLLDQVKVLQRIVNKEETTKLRKIHLPLLMEDLIQTFNDRLKEKGLALKYRPEEFAHVEVLGNKWLLTHSVFGNILNHAIAMSLTDGTLEVTHSKEKYFHHIIIRDAHSKFEGASPHGRGTERGLSCAKRVLQLLQGDLVFEANASGDLIYIIMLPVIN